MEDSGVGTLRTAYGGTEGTKPRSRDSCWDLPAAKARGWSTPWSHRPAWEVCTWSSLTSPCPCLDGACSVILECPSPHH